MPIHLLIFGERKKTKHCRQFSWLKQNGRSRSRIDLWLISPEIINYVANVSISAPPLTDHCAIEISLKSDCYPKCKKNYSKFNAELLNVEEYVGKVKALILEIKNDTELDTNCRNGNTLNIRSGVSA